MIQPTAPPSSTVPYGAQGQPPGTTIYIAPSQHYAIASSRTYDRRSYENYNSKQSHGVGVTVILVGVAFILLYTIVMIMYGASSTPIYCMLEGIWIVVTGSFGVSAAKQKTGCKIITFMVLCILTAIVCTLALIMTIFAIIVYSASTLYVEPGSQCEMIQQYDIAFRTASCRAILAVQVVHTTVLIIVTVTTYWGSILCCKVACCCATRQPGQIVGQPEFTPLQGVQQVVIPMQGGAQQVVVYNPAQQAEQAHGAGQSSQYPGIYPAPIYPGYPAPATLNAAVAGKYKPGYEDATYSPPSYEDCKNLL